MKKLLESQDQLGELREKIKNEKVFDALVQYAEIIDSPPGAGTPPPDAGTPPPDGEREQEQTDEKKEEEKK